MTTVSCPKCSDQVTVPSSAPRSARVRCPLCLEEYDLADVLAQLPPALIVLSAATSAELELAAVGEMEAATGSQAGLDRGFSSPLFDAGPTPAKLASAPTPAFRSAPRPKRKEKSMVGEVVKIVLGGVVGIGLAIVILWWGPGVDLGLAPSIAKVSWMRWVLPQKILERVDKSQGIKEENPDDLQPPNAGSEERQNQGESQASQNGKLGSNPRFDEALRTSEPFKASNDFSQRGKSKSATKGDEQVPLDIFDPLAPETKSSVDVGDLKLEDLLSTEPKESTKPAVPATNKAAEPSEPAEAKPPEKPVEKPEDTTPAEEKSPTVKPAEEKPAAEKPEEKPAESDETSPQEAPAGKPVS
jgi:hypothetical protein